MSGQTAHIGTGLGVIAVITGITGTAMIALGAPGWAWAGFAVWGLLWLTAALGLSDAASRAFLAGTLRKSTFTQIYTTLARRNVMRVWARLCDTAPDSASAPALFRAALTWRLYDFALRLAVVYPILLLVGQWVVTGAEGRVGSFVVLPGADFWPERAATLLIVLILTGWAGGAQLASASHAPLGKKAAGWLFSVALAAAAAAAVALALAGAVEVAFAVTVAFLVQAAIPAAVAATAAAAGAVAGLVAFAFAGAAGFAFAVLAAAGFAVALALGIAVLDRRGKQRLACRLATAGVVAAIFIAATTLDWAKVPEAYRSLFLFFGVLPLINALFDVVSYAVTLTLIRRGLRAKLPFLWGLADLGIACVLLLGLGATLVVVIHGLNMLAGVPLLDLPALFAGVRATPGAYWWLYLMLFSTLAPTLLHGFLSLLGVQGIWPLGLRRPVAGWVAAAPQSPLHAVRASLGLSVIWALPLLLLGAALWLLWLAGGGAMMRFLALYLDGLTWLAGGAIGAL